MPAACYAVCLEVHNDGLDYGAAWRDCHWCWRLAGDAIPARARGLISMTLVVVLLLGLGAVLIVSAIETDPTTGKSVSVLQTVQQIWNDQIDFGQPAGPPAQNGAGSAGGFSSTIPATGANGAVPLSYQTAATLAYVQQHQQ